jgi:sirohydrochlorin ferrochelatase
MYFDRTHSPTDTPMKSILLIDHGSRRDEANYMMACMANLVQHLVGETAAVRFAHMEICEPTIEQGFAACVEAGADEVIAFPYMLSPGRHSTSDIPAMVGRAAARFPGVAYRVVPAFGVHEHLADVILGRAGIARARELPDDSAGCCWDPEHSNGACGDACPARALIPAQ